MTLEPKPGGFIVRLRYGRDAAGKPQRDRFLIATNDETVAADIEIRMTAAAHSLSKLQHTQAREFLIEMGRVAGDAKAFRALERVVQKLCAEAAADTPPAVASAPSTFRDVAELWTSGKLTEQYPDSPLVPTKDARGRRTDRSEVSVFYPALGTKPITELTHDDIDAARRLIPKDLHPNTRRSYLIKLRLALRIAAGPLRLFATGAPPAVEIPRKKASNLFGYLYPQEEALLLGNTAIPLLYRVLYGYLSRNGCRIGETTQLTWDHVDLETGDIHIDKRWTKTQRARRWVLDSDVLEAFEAFHRVSGAPKPTALVFPGQKGQPIAPGTVLRRFRGDLKDSGVTRKTLLVGADGIQPLRIHDLRASFVTLALRAGKTTKWIMTRTGHETLGVLSVYDRLVQDANEHHLPEWFAPMAQAIPELRPRAPRAKDGPGLGQTLKTAQKWGRSRVQHGRRNRSNPGKYLLKKPLP